MEKEQLIANCEAENKALRNELEVYRRERTEADRARYAFASLVEDNNLLKNTISNLASQNAQLQGELARVRKGVAEFKQEVLELIERELGN